MKPLNHSDRYADDPGGDVPAGISLRSADDMAAIDAARLFTHLAAVGLHLDRQFAPRQFAGGLANLNYLIRLDGGWAVLRRPPAGPLPRGANDMGREHRILSRLWKDLPLAPRSFHLCTDAAVIGVPFQIIEFREGVAVRGDSLAPLPPTPATGAALSSMMIQTLAAIHAVDTACAGLDDLGHPEGFFARTVAGWLARAEHTGDGLPTAARAVADWLATLPAVADAAPVLLHNDFKLDNLLIDPSAMAPYAVIDWDMGTRGPALFDLATMLSYWTEAGDPDCMHRLAQMPTAAPGFVTREGAAKAYARATGRQIEAIAPYRVLTVFKLAVVFRQLHRRHVSGETRDPRYAGFGVLGDELFGVALDIARGRIF